MIALIRWLYQKPQEETETHIVLKLDLEHLTPEESKWLHDLRNRVQLRSGLAYMARKAAGK